MHVKHLMQQLMTLALAALMVLSLHTLAAHAAEPGKKKADKTAILLVTFGTSVEKAQASFINIEKRVKAAFPGTEVRWAYTSNIIRKKLAKEENKQIDSPEMALARLMDEGYTKVAVQSLHMIPGAEFHEINANARLFGQMAGGINEVKVSLPLLISDETMDQALKTIVTKVVPKERKPGEAVVLMGHGTHHPSDAMYSALMYKAQQMDANLYCKTARGLEPICTRFGTAFNGQINQIQFPIISSIRTCDRGLS